MAKKRSVSKAARSGETSPKTTSDDQVKAAAAAVKRARKTLDQAMESYDRARETARQQASKARGVTVGDVIDGTLDFTRNHPAISLLTAGLIGFLFGRTRGR